MTGVVTHSDRINKVMEEMDSHGGTNSQHQQSIISRDIKWREKKENLIKPEAWWNLDRKRKYKHSLAPHTDDCWSLLSELKWNKDVMQ